MSQNIAHRLDIQFFRGISVLLVVFYHLNIPGFSNGYLGVDIFFVLSGFLMATLTRKVSVFEFYKRRLKNFKSPMVKNQIIALELKIALA